ncbi:MAG TPA: PRC-barrel domain-containing protein [Steroidobacteraceae bacterium]|nr:PRC-barrel domain-containing protein [Steroidobacteraceae bacterium]
MIRIILPLVCAALGLAAASCSQSEDPFASTKAPAASRAPLHGAASAAMAPRPDSQQAQAAGASTPATDQTSPGTTQPAATPPDQTSPGTTQPAAAPPDQTSSGQTPGDQVPSLDETPPPAASQASTSPPTTEPAPDLPASTPAERRASTLIGMPVVSADGSPLGGVKDVIFDRQGRATHLVIAYGAAPPDAGPADIADAGKQTASPDGKLTAMPWDAAVASIKGGRVVLDGAKLQEAPSFAPQAWPNLDNPAWSAAADTYWRKAVRAAIAAHPGAPIDSTTRQRSRRTRGE